MPDSGSLWGEGFARFLRDNWLVFIILVGGAVWATNVDGDIKQMESERAILSEQVRSMNNRIIMIQNDVAYIRGLLDSVPEE